jgi:hypothetical protein
MRPIYQAIIAGAVSGLVSKGVDKYNIINMKSIFQTFIIELWPMWLGIFVFLIYMAIIDYIKLKKWIGLYSYKDKYHDLKGKIIFYIKEELKNKSNSNL